MASLHDSQSCPSFPPKQPLLGMSPHFVPLLQWVGVNHQWFRMHQFSKEAVHCISGGVPALTLSFLQSASAG